MLVLCLGLCSKDATIGRKYQLQLDNELQHRTNALWAKTHSADGSLLLQFHKRHPSKLVQTQSSNSFDSAFYAGCLVSGFPVLLFIVLRSSAAV